MNLQISFRRYGGLCVRMPPRRVPRPMRKHGARRCTSQDITHEKSNMQSSGKTLPNISANDGLAARQIMLRLGCQSPPSLHGAARCSLWPGSRRHRRSQHQTSFRCTQYFQSSFSCRNDRLTASTDMAWLNVTDLGLSACIAAADVWS